MARAVDLSSDHLKTIEDLSHIRIMIELAHDCGIQVHPKDVPSYLGNESRPNSCELSEDQHAIYVDIYAKMCEGRSKDDYAFRKGIKQPMEDKSDDDEQLERDSQAEVIMWFKEALSFIDYWGYFITGDGVHCGRNDGSRELSCLDEDDQKKARERAHELLAYYDKVVELFPEFGFPEINASPSSVPNQAGVNLRSRIEKVVEDRLTEVEQRCVVLHDRLAQVENKIDALTAKVEAFIKSAEKVFQ